MIEGAIATLKERGLEVAAAVLAGGKEKLPAGALDAIGTTPVRAGDDPLVVFDETLQDVSPELVVDLSDEPVLDYRQRHRFASIALYRDVIYEGPDFRFTPPARPRLAEGPSIAVIGTGKRTGKTAVCGFTARTLKAAGWSPVVVAMGRGGPEEPEVLRGDHVELTPEFLLEMVAAGKHAASDYVEDALLGRVPTVGCRRCGGGLAGGIDISNVPAGVALANGIDSDLMLLEGSGSSIPPVHADATVLIVPASIPEEYLTGYWGPYKLLLADLVVVTMCESPFGTPSQISQVSSLIRNSYRPKSPGGPKRDLQILRTVFRPVPTRTVEDAAVFVATTAPEAAQAAIRSSLEEKHGCRVVGVSHSLGDREKLTRELEQIKGKADVLLCEVKAAGIDVATKKGLDAGLDVIYMDNVPEPVDGSDVSQALELLADLARERNLHD